MSYQVSIPPMHPFSRGLAVALVGLLLAAPAASAVPGFPTLVDEKIGEVQQRLDSANQTYGERDEFKRAKADLSRAGLSLLHNASAISVRDLTKTVAALETGKARAQAGVGPDGTHAKVHERAHELHRQAEATIEQVRSNLESREKTGFGPLEMDGSLTVAHLVVRAMQTADQFQHPEKAWHSPDRNADIEAALVSSGAGALFLAELAQETLRKTTQASANRTAEHRISYEEIQKLAEDRVAWANSHTAPAAKQSHDLVKRVDEQGSRTLTLAAFIMYVKDLTFNSINVDIQRGQLEMDPVQKARDLYEENAPRVGAWSQLLGAPLELPHGAMEGANLTLLLNGDRTGDQRNRSGAFALSDVHFAIEHTALLQEAFGNHEHQPGTSLEAASIGPAETQEEGGLLETPGLLFATVALAFVAAAATSKRR